MNRYLVTPVLSVLLSVFIYSFTYAGEPTCGTRNWGDIQAKYCVEKPIAGDSDTVLVYFHGLGGNEMEWFTSPGMQTIRDELRTRKFDPWIITVSYGKAWILTEVPHGLLFPKTVDELLPDLFNSIRPAGFAHKYLAGASMGGLNTSEVMLKRPHMFDKFMMICPAITTVGPYAPDREVLDYVMRTGAQAKRVAFMLQWARLEFPKAADWASHSPLLLADRNIALPEVYLSCGMKDEFGFQEGAHMLYAKVRPKATRAWWVPIPDGVHCAVDPKSIVDFLTTERNLH
jgi:pimeloyl-ACP methyl ester carboxylesterase